VESLTLDRAAPHERVNRAARQVALRWCRARVIRAWSTEGV